MTRQYRMGHARLASSLIMVIMLIVLMVSMAVSFMSLVGRQRGSALITAAQTKADIALQQAQTHVIKTMVESVADPLVEYTTVYNPSWRTEFAAVTDPDGDPYTEDGIARWPGTKYTTAASTTLVSGDELVNSRASLFDMTGQGTSRSYPIKFGFGLDYDRWNGSGYECISRWHNVEYLDAHFQHIAIDDTLTEASKADLRRGARYVVRYIAQVMDLNGMQTINNNYPNGPIAPGVNLVNDLEYLRFQNYLRCYGRSIKSQFACPLGNYGLGMQRRSNDPNFISTDPLDREVCNINVNGSVVANPYGSIGYTLETDARLRAERAFRGDLQWAGQSTVSGDRYDMLGPLNKSRVYSWGQINQTFIGEDLRYPWSDQGDVHAFAPFGEGINNFSLSETVPTPWYVNLLTCPNNALVRMVMGFSSQLHFSRTSNVITNGDRASQADLFGVSYPEAFPLGLDAGRDVPLVGEGTVDIAGFRIVKENGTSFEGFPAFIRGGRAYFTSGIGGQGGIQASPGYENSYFFDVAMALNMAIRNVREVWVRKATLDSGAEQRSPAVNPHIFLYKNGTNNSYISSTVSDPDEMLKLVIRETYRVLGEGFIDTSSTPAKSKNFYDRGADVNNANDKYRMGLLAGGINNVGLGSMGFWERRAELSSTANTRAMEYVLNDVMINLFGKANPEFNAIDPRNTSGSFDPISENIAVDFNNDGVAESTVTGWIDPETNQRVWSFWWDGLGPYVKVNTDFMKYPAWYRLYRDGSIRRKNGSEWILLSAGEITDFRAYNVMWLTGNTDYPLRPQAKTGRFFIGKSKVLQGFVRGEVYNILNGSSVVRANRSFMYHVDPNHDGNYSDSHVLRQSDFSMKE